MRRAADLDDTAGQAMSKTGVPVRRTDDTPTRSSSRRTS
jgi:hypothetical protein